MSSFLSQSDDQFDSALLSERRCRVRHLQNLCTYAQRGDGDLDQHWWSGTVRNISGSGIGLILQHHFETGTSLTIELENVGRTISHTLHVEVVRVRPEQRGWLLGCAFARELTEAELNDLLQ